METMLVNKDDYYQLRDRLVRTANSVQEVGRAEFVCGLLVGLCWGIIAGALLLPQKAAAHYGDETHFLFAAAENNHGLELTSVVRYGDITELQIVADGRPYIATIGQCAVPCEFLTRRGPVRLDVGSCNDGWGQVSIDLHWGGEPETVCLQEIRERITVSHAGVQGPQGIQGLQGEQGIRGPPGVQGERGERGLQGERGVPGKDGVDGKDSTVPGPQGEQGIQGERGLPGIPGPRGIQGIQGEQGERGPQGLPGRDGSDGRDGQDGEDGQDGSDGRDGQDGGTTTPPDEDEETVDPVVTPPPTAQNCAASRHQFWQLADTMWQTSWCDAPADWRAEVDAQSCDIYRTPEYAAARDGICASYEFDNNALVIDSRTRFSQNNLSCASVNGSGQDICRLDNLHVVSTSGYFGILSQWGQADSRETVTPPPEVVTPPPDPNALPTKDEVLAFKNLKPAHLCPGTGGRHTTLCNMVMESDFNGNSGSHDVENSMGERSTPIHYNGSAAIVRGVSCPVADKEKYLVVSGGSIHSSYMVVTFGGGCSGFTTFLHQLEE